MKGILINPDGSVADIFAPEDGQERWKCLQQLLQGSIQVFSTDRFTFYCHEEGKVIGLLPNPTATALCTRADVGLMETDVVAGALAIFGPSTDAGVQALAPAGERWLREQIREAAKPLSRAHPSRPVESRN